MNNYEYFDNKTVVIQYETIYEDNTNNEFKIFFDNIIYNEFPVEIYNDDIIYDNISTTMETNNLILNAKY